MLVRSQRKKPLFCQYSQRYINSFVARWHIKISNYPTYIPYGYNAVIRKIKVEKEKIPKTVNIYKHEIYGFVLFLPSAVGAAWGLGAAYYVHIS
jgi:hypothetical protein